MQGVPSAACCLLSPLTSIGRLSGILAKQPTKREPQSQASHIFAGVGDGGESAGICGPSDGPWYESDLRWPQLAQKQEVFMRKKPKEEERRKAEIQDQESEVEMKTHLLKPVPGGPWALASLVQTRSGGGGGCCYVGLGKGGERHTKCKMGPTCLGGGCGPTLCHNNFRTFSL